MRGLVANITAGLLALASYSVSAQACTLKSYDLTPHTLAKLQEIKGLAEGFAELETLGHYTIALGGFRAILEGPKDATVPYQIYAEQWQILGQAANGLSSHLRDQLKLLIDFERLNSGLNASERQFWADLRKGIGRKPIDPSQFKDCGDPRQARDPADQDAASTERVVVTGGGEEGGTFGGGFGGDLYGPSQENSVGGDLPCSLFDGRTCWLDYAK